MKVDKFFLVKFAEVHGEGETSIHQIFKISCEEGEAEEFLKEMIDASMSEWYGEQTYRDGVSFCNADDSSYVFLKNKKEIQEATFQDISNLMYTEIYDIDEIRKQMLISSQ